MQCTKCHYDNSIVIDDESVLERMRYPELSLVYKCIICGCRYHQDPKTKKWTDRVGRRRRERELPLHKVNKRPHHRSLGI